MESLLLILNFTASSASALAAIIAIAHPASLSSSTQVTSGELFYARMYAVRSIPLGILAGLLPFWYGGPAVALLVLTAGVIQAADVVIGVGRGDLGMVLGASVGAVVHGVFGFVVLGRG